MTGMQFVAIASILNLTIGLNLTVGIFIGWGLLTAKTYLGGLKAVIWQDVIQGTILTIGVILLFFIIIKDSSGWNTIVANAQLENQEAMLDIFNITPTEILIYLLTLRSEEHTSELQSRGHLVCRLLLEKKKQEIYNYYTLQ